jgi:HPt (histidine-containing phosphotransfer) domain-containing protein
MPPAGACFTDVVLSTFGVPGRYVSQEDIMHSTQSSFDVAVLLDRVGGDRELLREITDIFLAEYPGLLAEMRTAIRSQDARSLERSAHTLKGSVSNFGAPAATQAAYQLETLGRRAEMKAAPQHLQDLESELQQLSRHLLDYTASLH